MAETDPFDTVLDEIRELNRRKRGDYASDADPWSNFREAGEHAGLPAGKIVEALIGVKNARLRNLVDSERSPNNESVEDTLVDRAVYSIIAVAMYREGSYA